MIEGCYFVNDKRQNPPRYATAVARLVEMDGSLLVKYLVGYRGEVLPLDDEHPEFLDDDGFVRIPTPHGIMEFTFATLDGVLARDGIEVEVDLDLDGLETDDDVQMRLDSMCGEME